LNNEIYGNGSIDDLKESISKYGLDQPLIINENNRLLSGHRFLVNLRSDSFISVLGLILAPTGKKIQAINVTTRYQPYTVPAFW